VPRMKSGGRYVPPLGFIGGKTASLSYSLCLFDLSFPARRVGCLGCVFVTRPEVDRRSFSLSLNDTPRAYLAFRM